jgi:predicted RNase H-like HicB family nuclease
MDPIRVIYHQEPEGWWAESPDIEGWYVTGATFEATQALAEDHARYATGTTTSQSSTTCPLASASPRSAANPQATRCNVGIE